MLSEQEAREAVGSTAYSSDDEKLGKVGQVFLDDQSGRPEFITVQTGLFGTKESFMPVSEANFSGDRLTVPYTKDKVKDAPNVDADGGHLDHDEEERLYAYYGMDYSSSGDSGHTDTDRGVGHDTSGPNTDEAMTRSEEQLRVGTTEEETGRVRLRKYVTTEQETHTIPVRKERAVLETEPITEGNVGDATSGPAISEEEHEVTLSEERPVVEKTVEPVERVRVGKETVTEDETVTEEVRKEQIDADGDVTDRR
ncbi:MAG: DUF2382 domain-containing protein [Nocardioides sp.]